MQGLKKNRKKMKKPGAFAVCMHTAKDIWSLCRAHTHGKGATWRKPVDLGSQWVCLEISLPCMLAPGRTAKRSSTATTGRTATSGRTAASTTHGRDSAHGKGPSARQRARARQRIGRTAKGRAHGKALCRACWSGARQCCLCRRGQCRADVAVRRRTAKPLPCKIGSLPCDRSHGNACFSRSESHEIKQHF